jgi:hypothetical protein
MATWKYSGTEVSDLQVKTSLEAIAGACFKCETESSECPIAQAAADITAMQSGADLSPGSRQ